MKKIILFALALITSLTLILKPVHAIENNSFGIIKTSYELNNQGMPILKYGFFSASQSFPVNPMNASSSERYYFGSWLMSYFEIDEYHSIIMYLPKQVIIDDNIDGYNVNYYFTSYAYVNNITTTISNNVNSIVFTMFYDDLNQMNIIRYNIFDKYGYEIDMFTGVKLTSPALNNWITPVTIDFNLSYGYSTATDDYYNGYSDGYNKGLDVGYNNGYNIGRNDYGKYVNGQYITADDYSQIVSDNVFESTRAQYGYQAGDTWLTADQYGDNMYDIGYNAGLSNEIDWFSWSMTFFLMPFRIMNIQVLPGVRIGYFALFSLLLGVVGWFFFIVGKGGGKRK